MIGPLSQGADQNLSRLSKSVFAKKIIPPKNRTAPDIMITGLICCLIIAVANRMHIAPRMTDIPANSSFLFLFIMLLLRGKRGSIVKTEAFILKDR